MKRPDYNTMNIKELASSYRDYKTIISSTMTQEGRDTTNTIKLRKELKLMEVAFSHRKNTKLSQLSTQIELLQARRDAIQSLTLDTILDAYS